MFDVLQVNLPERMAVECGKNISSEMSLQEDQDEIESSSGTAERPNSPGSSCVSLKSDHAMLEPLNLKEGSAPSESGTAERPNSPGSSCVSFKSDQSMGEPHNFKQGSAPPESGTADRSNSPGSSCVSFKSDQSMGEPHNFKQGSAPPENGTAERPNSPGSSCVSFKSDQSMGEPHNFKQGSAPPESDTGQTADSSVSSQEPVKKNKRQKPALQKSLSKDCPSQQRGHMGSELDAEADKPQRNPKDFFDIFNDLENKMIAFIKHELEMYKKLLRKENTTYYRNVKQMKWNLKQSVLNMTLTFLNLMNHKDVATALQNELIGIIQRPLKEGLISKFDRVCEGIAKQGESTRLNEIYTDLYITEGGAGQVNKEHEVRRIEKNQMQQDVQIKCKNMFEPLPGQDRPIRTVLTQGVAGIGKSICVQKFILDWAEGEDHQDIQFIFPLPFRELNLKKGRQSLMDIIGFFFPETKGLILTDQNSVMFVFDGLDECKLPLMFQENESLNDVCKPASLDVVLTNLIKGNLLPSALIWITTRPAAASRIPAECVDRVTKVRGFNDQQKEEYFRKRISDENLATKIIEHIKESRSLFIMCHIPVFCWISATVLQRILEETESGETPKTLTEMYTCFLIFQAVQGNQKYSGKNVLDVPWDKEAINSLGKLAFQHLEENSLIFNAEDLEACGVDPSKISVYSGLCTQETVRFLGTVFSFVHLSIQEFLAAVFAYLSLRNDHKNVFDQQSTSEESKTTEHTELLKTAVDKALKSDHGHLDLFLRFLLGLSLESNEKLIRGLLTQSGSRSDCRKEIVEYIKLKFKDNPSPERSINLFYCLNELNDDSLVKDIQSHMSSGSLSEAELSPAQWSALVFVLLTSKEKLEVFDLQKFIRSEECLNRLLPVVQEATTALLSECNLTERSCSALLKVLSSGSSTLTLLDLSNNPIQDFGVELLSEGLKSPTCKLETLRISFCSVTEKGYIVLASALKSNPPPPLKELDLKGNDPGDTGVKKLTDLVPDTTSKLIKLRLLKSDAAEEVCNSLTEALGINPLLLTELDLSGKIQGDSAVKKLSGLLEDSHCRTKILKLNNSSTTEEGCTALSSALCLNPSHLIELDLSNNKLGNSGVTKLCALLNNQSCKLQKLGFSDCSVTKEGYVALASALKSNTSSHLIELDLRGNNPGDQGVKLITDLKKDPNSKLKTLRLLKCDAAVEFCDYLTEALGINPLLLTELDLSGKIKGDSAVKKLSALLEDSHCRTQILKLSNSSITEEGCAALSAAICSNPSHLIELDLSENKLGKSGVKQICDTLNNSDCQLQKLDFSFCNITEQGYTDLESALRSNPSSHLTELVLKGNDPGDTGVKILNDLIENSQHKLNNLRLLKSSAAEEICTSLTKALGINPLLLTELNLSGKIQGDSAVKKLSDLLEDSHCRTQILKLNKSRITEEGCAALSAALCSNSSHLVELDLSENKLENPGVKHLCDLLNNQYCKLQRLKLSFCSVTEEGYTSMASTLKNSSSPLIELDLRGNDPGDTGVKKITDLLHNIKKIRLLDSSAAEEICDHLTEALGINPLLLTELDLSGKIQGDSEIKKLSDLLEDSHCRTQILKLKNSNITEKGCAALSSALCLNPSHLMELDLSGNKVLAAGVKHISAMLSNPQSELQKLTLSDCSVTEDGYAALASALKLNPSSHLMELDLRGNDPGDKGVKDLHDLLLEPQHKLSTLRLLKSSAAEEICDHLTEALGTNPLLLTELDLSGKIQGDSAVKKLSDLLKDSHCRTQILKLNKSRITEEGCAALSAALCSNCSHLVELDLSENKLGNPGVKHLCDLLNNQCCKLQRLTLSFCSVTEEGYTSMASTLKNSSSPLIELDLRGNDPGDTGVKKITDLHHNIKKIRLLDSSAAEELCDHLTEALGTNPLLLTELDLSGKIQGDSEIKKLSDLLEDSHCRTQILKLKNSNITEEGCAALSSALCLNPSHLMELDLSGNKVLAAGVKHISAMLSNPQSELQKLILSDCSVTEDGYAALASALKLNPSSHLMELDLRGNDPGDKGVKDLHYLLVEPQHKLSTLRLLKSSAAEEICDYLTEALGTNPLLLTELDLSEKIQGDSAVKKLSDLLKDSHCRTQILKLNKSRITEEGCAALSAALCSNSLHLVELDLSENKLGNPGVKHLCDLLNNQYCKLQRLKLSFCSVTEEGYTSMASTLKNSSSPLIELDLRGNDPGDTGVKKITDLLHNIKKIRLLDSFAAEEICDHLTESLGINPLLLTELDLSGKIQGDSEIKKLSALLEDSHCRTQILKLKNSNITEEGCAALSSALCLNPSHLMELDLSGNKVLAAGVKHISAMLSNPQSELQKLILSDCSVTENGYAALASALKLNPSSHLMELDLRGNDPGDKGVKDLHDLLLEPQHKLSTLRLLKSSAAEEICDYLTEALGTNPLLLTELDLSEKIQGHSAVKKLSDLLKDSHCRTQILKLNKSRITEEGCAALSAALCSNCSHLVELDLSENKLGNPGVKHLCDLLNNQYLKLQTLKLSFCSVTEEGYTSMASTLKNSSSPLIELDLRGNDPGDTGVKKITDLHHNIKKIRLLDSSAAEEICDHLTEALGINPLLLTELDLSGKIQGDSEIKKLSDLLEDSHCRTQILKLKNSNITEEGCAALSSALCLNPSHLMELDLSGNKVLAAGVKHISAMLSNPQSELQKLILSDCSVTEEGYAALASALKLNPSSHLMELDLRGNDPGDKGVKDLHDLLLEPQHKLSTLRLLKSSAAEEICDHLTKALGTNPLLLTELDLSGKIQGDSEMKKLSDLLKDSHCRTQILKLNKSRITEEGCAALSAALCSNCSHLVELDLSENKLGNPGVKHLCDLLNNQYCKLQRLKLSFCSVTEEGYTSMASTLKNSSSPLIELDLRGNDPGDTGVKKITDLHHNIKKIRLLDSSAAEELCDHLTEALGTNPLLLTELDLSGKIQGDFEIKKLSALLEDSHCRTPILKLKNSNITEEGCAALSSALCLNPSHLMELDLSGNKVLAAGVKHISAMLSNPQSELQKLTLSDCSVTEEGYAALASALKLNPSSHLMELDLRGNDPGDKGVKDLHDLLLEPQHKLSTLRLLKSSAAEEICDYLTEALGTNPLLLTELDLSEKIQGHSAVKKLSDLLKDSHCRTQILKLNKSRITEEGCAALSAALCSNSLHLVELDLSENKLENPGVKHLCDLLNNQYCKLQRLKLSFCSVTEEGYTSMASTLKNSSSPLIELDLRGNDPGDTGVKKITDLHHNIKKIRLLDSSAAEEICDHLTEALGINPLLLTELDLSGKIQGDSEIKKLSDLLEDSHCRTQILKLKNSNITEEGCAALSSALCLNPSHLMELDLSGNKVLAAGVKHISAMLSNPQSELQKLILSDCSVTEDGYAALASALKLNPSSHLMELDLRGNDPGDKGVKDLHDLLLEPQHKLSTLRLLKSSAAEEICDHLTEALGTNPLLLTKLDLSGKIQGDSEMKKLSALLEDSHCRTQILKLINSDIAADGCASLSAALCVNISHLIELDLGHNKIGNSGVKHLGDLLNNQYCKLQILSLSFCSVTEDGYSALASALKSNPSSTLTDLDLRGNDPGNKGVELITELRKDPNSKLKTLRLLKSSAAKKLCDHLTEALGINPLLLTELDLSGRIQGDSEMKQLSDLLEDSHCRTQKLKLYNNSLTEKGCADLRSALCCNPSYLMELDVKENKIGNSGVKNICGLLNNQCCKLQFLGLAFCSVTGEGYAALASSLQSNPSSHLAELDLRGNDPGDTGVKKLTDLVEDPNCKLNKLSLLKSSAAEEICDHLTEALETNPLLLTELDLSGKIQGDSEMKKLSDLVEDSHCRTQILKLDKNNFTEKGIQDLSSALSSNPLHLMELYLCNNALGNAGVKHICDVLENQHCKLQTLGLSFCNVTEEGYEALASALKSNSSHLMELDLRGNDPGDKGVKLLTELLEDPNCKLKTLRLLKSSAAEKAHNSLTEALGINPLLLTELNLSGKIQGDSDVKEICPFLEDSHCKIKRLWINDDDLTEESCSALATVLTSSTLTELDLSSNNLQDSGVKELCSGLKDPLCKLKKLSLSFCRITEGGYAALASALKSSSSALTELDLRGNDPGDTGVKQLTGLFMNTKKKLRLLKSDAAKEAYTYFKQKLGKDPLLQTELDLSQTEPKKIRVDQLSALLEDPHCRLQKLTMYKSSSITVRDCADLISALTVNPSHLRELDLNENKLDQAGLQKLCDLLKNPHCRLEKLSLRCCCISEEGYAALASALNLNTSSPLMELDLRGNDPGDKGVKLIMDLEKDSQTKGRRIRLLKSSAAEKLCDHLTEALGTNPLLLRELDLSGRIQGDSEMNQLSDLLEDSHCRTQILKLNNSRITEEGCAALSAALSSNPSHLIELDLSENKLGNPGVKQICDLLTNQYCKLQRLRLSDCSVSEEGYAALASALKSFPSSPLMELDLRGNDPGDRGVELLNGLLQEPDCKVKTLRLLKTDAAEEAWTSLSSALRINILLQTELKLSRNPAGPSGDSRVKLLCAVLQDTHCKLRRLWINDDDLTEASCSALATVLTSSTLRELDLSSNNLQDSGVKKLCRGLKDPLCKLQTLRLSFCNIREEGYTALGSALSSALRSTVSSPFVELDLRGNDPGDTGVELLVNLSVKKLRLLKSDAAEEAYTYFKQKLGKDPLLQTELDLSQTEPKEIRVDQLSALLEDPHCRLQKLTMYKSSSITERDCADLISALTVNPSHLRELDLNENKLDQAGLQKLCDLLKNPHCRLEKLSLQQNSITERDCADLISALTVNPSHLRELDLNENKLDQAGLQKLCDLLKNPHCRLEKLSLRCCCISEEGYAALASALNLNTSSPLMELDLRGNDPGDKGVKLIMDLEKDSQTKGRRIRLLKSSAAEKLCDHLTEALGTNPLLLRELDLSGRIQGDSEMNQLSDLLKDSHCRPEKIKLNNSSITEEGCAALSAALSSNPSHLKELDLSENKLGNPGVKKICNLLKILDCRLAKLNLSDCSVTQEGYKHLASALKSNPSSHLTELDLRGNDPGDSGVKKLTDLVEDSNCKMKTLRLLKTAAAEEAWTSLSSTLRINMLLQTELKLSRNPAGPSGDSRVKLLCAVLQDTHCKLRRLWINDDDLTEESCSALATVLTSSTLRELDLSSNNLQDSGVKELCSGLKDPLCKLKKLSLSFCRITEGGYAALASALKSSSSALTELDLRGNDPGDTGVKQLTGLFVNTKKILRLLKSDAAKEAYTYFKQKLGKDPLLQTELDLSQTEPKKIRVDQLSALLEDPHCRLQKLTMYKSSSITVRDCADLISALTVNPSHLRELDLNENKLDQAGLQKLCDLLKNPHCRLEKLRLVQSLTEGGCADLALALYTNPSHIRELDLSLNKLGASGVKQLCRLVENQKCELQKLQLKKCSIEEDGCAALTSALSSNPSHLRELDLRGNKLGKSVEQLSELMKKSGCSLQLDKSLLNRIASWFWGNTDKTQHSANQEKPEEDDEVGEQGGAGQCNQTSVQTAGEREGARQGNRTSVQTAGERNGAGHCNRTSEQTAGEREGACQGNRTSVQTAEERGGAGQDEQNSEQTAGERDGAGQGNRTSVQTAGERAERVRMNRTLNRLQGNGTERVRMNRTLSRLQGSWTERGRMNRTLNRLQGNRTERVRMNRTLYRLQGNGTEWVRGTGPLYRLQGKGTEWVRMNRTLYRLQGNRTSVQTAGERGGAGQDEQNSEQTAGERDRAGQDEQNLYRLQGNGKERVRMNRTLYRLQGNGAERVRMNRTLYRLQGNGAERVRMNRTLYRLQGNRTSVQTAGERGGAGQDEQNSEQTAGEWDGAGQDEQNSVQTAGERDGAGQDEQNSEQTAGERDRAGQDEQNLYRLQGNGTERVRMNRTLYRLQGNGAERVRMNRTLYRLQGNGAERVRMNRTLYRLQGNRTSVQTAGERGGAGQDEQNSEQTAGERDGAGQDEQNSVQTAGERDGAGQDEQNSVQTAGERDRAGQDEQNLYRLQGNGTERVRMNRTLYRLQWSGAERVRMNRTLYRLQGSGAERVRMNRTLYRLQGNGAERVRMNRTLYRLQGNRTSVQTAGEWGGAGQDEQNSVQTTGERDGAGQCNRTSGQTAGEREGAGQCNRTSVQTAGERDGAGQCNRTSVQTAGERGRAGQCNRTSVQTAGERDGAGQCNRTSVQTAGERDGAGQCNRTSVQTAGERDGSSCHKNKKKQQKKSS
ncbi:uncharacterized protein [Salminus brasiliensis]|uniref:uncharacterized protein n=1 Tax=Salminus brasiliensis TaxID=930266 RepID=UPI003B838884